MPNRWPHDTHEKLEANGYRLYTGPDGNRADGIAPCKYPPCEKQVIFYITPKGKEMPFEAVQITSGSDCGNVEGQQDFALQPHAATCEGYRKREADRKAQKAMGVAAIILVLLTLATPAQAAPKHWYKDWKWYAGAALIVASTTVDVHSSCRAFSGGYYEQNFILRGSRSCGQVAGVAFGTAAFAVGMHALAWHCNSNVGWKCYGLNQNEGKHKTAWNVITYTAIPAAFGVAHVPVAIHNYRLPMPNPTF